VDVEDLRVPGAEFLLVEVEAAAEGIPGSEASEDR
jgi:hypothetical protein